MARKKCSLKVNGELFFFSKCQADLIIFLLCREINFHSALFYFCIGALVYQRTVGQNVTLPCTAPLSTNFSDWFFQNVANESVQYVSSAGTLINGFRTDERFTLSSGISHDTSLHVRNLTTSDSGVYVCRTLLHNGQRVQHTFWLTVQRKNFFVQKNFASHNFYICWL